MFRYGENSNTIIHTITDTKSTGYHALNTFLDKHYTRRLYI